MSALSIFALTLAAAPTTIVDVDVVDVVPVAVAVVAGAGEAGPCGLRAAFTLLRIDVDRFLADPTAVPTTPRPLPTTATTPAGPARALPLLAGPGLFVGEAEILAAAVDAALLKAKVTTTAPTTLVWSGGQPALRLAVSADAAVVEAALRAFVPTTAWLDTTTATVAKARAVTARTPGTQALARVDARLCLGSRATATTTVLSPAVVRAALAAPLLPG